MKALGSFVILILLFSFLPLSSFIKRAKADNGLLAYWKFDEGSGTMAADSSGNGYIGTLYGGPAWVVGKRENALSFDGVDDYVSINNSTGLDPHTSNWTISAWVNIVKLTPQSPGIYSFVIVGKRQTVTDKSLTLCADFGSSATSQARFNFCFDGSYQSAGAWTPFMNVFGWHYVAGVRTGGDLYVYVDGVKYGPNNFLRYGNQLTPTTDISSSTPVHLAHHGAWNTYYNGTVDDVRICDRALTQEEIQSDMGASTTMDYSDDFSRDTGLWTYCGNAYRDNVNKDVVLTEAVNAQAGGIWLNESVRSSFIVRFRYWVGNSTGTRTDGFVVKLYKQIDYSLPKGGYLGFSGLGYGIEFDTFPNAWDPSGNHVALIKDSCSNHVAWVDDTRVSDNAWHNVTMTVASSSIAVYLDSERILGWNGILNTTYGGFGISGATGEASFQANDKHIIDDFSIDVPFSLIPINDEFGGTVLNPAWNWTNPSGDCNYSLVTNPGFLRISAPGDGHDLNPLSNYNAPRVIQSTSGNFVAETRILCDPQYNAQGAGILIWTDSDNYLRLDRINHIGGQVVDLVGKKAGTWLDSNQSTYLLAEAYLRLERTGDMFIAKYGMDGINWTTLCTASFPFIDPVSIGLFVLDQGQNNPIYADFDYFRVGNPFQTNKLTVCVVDNSALPVNNALVGVANLTAYSNAFGYTFFDLPFGTYNVTASCPDYRSTSWIVDLNMDKNITLTLAYPYVLQGEISNSSMIITPIQSGYNITILNDLVSSSIDIFFDWKRMGAVLPGTWQSFSFDHLPNLIVEAATKGTADYPKAWFKHPLPIPLTPTTGNEGAFPPEPTPYVAGSIFVIPYPPVYGQNTTIGVTLHNPYNHTLHLSRADFQISGLTVGGFFTSVGYISDISLQANETRVFSIKWNATVGGHHCIRVVLTYSPMSQTLQRNIDVENDVIQGGTGEVSFSLVNPFETSQEMTIRVNKQLALGSEVTLEIDGRKYDTSSDITIDVAPGQELHTTLRIKTGIALEDGVVDIEAYVDGQLIGGVRKTIKTIPPIACISISGPSGQPMGFEGETLLVSGTGWFPGSLVKLYMQSGMHYLGSVYADEEGKFAIPCGIPGLGPVPLPGVVVSAESDKQSDWKLFLYLGNVDDLSNLGDCWKAVIGADLLQILGDEYPKYAMRIFYAKTGAELLYNTFTKPDVSWDLICAVTTVIAKVLWSVSIGGVLKCGGAIVAFVTKQHHHVDVAVRTANGTIGTTGSGEYINSVNGSWASGNSFDDFQLFLVPFVSGFNVTIDSTRAAYEVESYNMSVTFSCGRVNRTANLQLQGDIQRGSSATYEVGLTNWTISASPLHNVRALDALSKSVVGEGYSTNIKFEVANAGYYAETFNVTASINNTAIGTKAVTLLQRNSTILTFVWNTTGFARGNYTISVVADPVANETDVADNTFVGGWVLVTIPGDINADRKVDLKDVFAVGKAYGSVAGDSRYKPNLDINGDGKIDLKDYFTTCKNYGKSW